MDGDRFDTCLRAVSRGGSRRQALRGLALALAGFASGSAAAKDRRHDRPPLVDVGKGHKGLTGQVAGGTPVPPGKYPFAVSLHMRGVEWGFLCSGSLIGPSHVLTAAHCTVDPLTRVPFPPSAYTVVVGQVDRTTTHCAACQKRVTAVAAAAGMDHPHDVAVLTLDAPVDARIAQPIALVGSDARSLDGAGQSAIVAGWGLTTTGGSASTVLMEAPLTVLPDAACGNDPATHLCTAITAGRAPCPGDSGAPLFVPMDGASVAAAPAARA
ncbi:MAG TPA: serine protease, partial [Thermomicrobiales bacterium]|nr:serine protease [Thermomicrobiales bacterium]